MEIQTTRDIVFNHIKDYFPDDERWNTDRWVNVDDLLKLLNDNSITCFEDLQDNLTNLLTVESKGE